MASEFDGLWETAQGVLMIRQWWSQLFSRVGADLRSKPDDFEHCCCCGQAFNTQDLQQVPPHFEHQLGLNARPVKDLMSDDDVQPPLPNVVPFRCRGMPAKC